MGAEVGTYRQDLRGRLISCRFSPLSPFLDFWIVRVHWQKVNGAAEPCK
jgi:hypothetical protein